MMFIPKVARAATNEPITLDEFCSFCASVGKFETIDDFLIALPALQRLSLNRTLLDEKFAPAKHLGKSRVQQSILLAGREHFFVRAMLWPAIPATDINAANLYKYAYCVPHDHNFSFMTIGYFGPGYRTKFYRSERGFREVKKAEQIELEEADDVVLGRGDCAIVQAYDDVHIQYPPRSFSISLNLVPRSKFRFKQAFMSSSGSVVHALEGSSHHGFFMEICTLLDSDHLRGVVDQYYGAVTSSSR
ncbi:hypothetical protein [Xanthomonas oryzae]|uniref:hypothetical protein n=1 Tax=Xanthomonas oryzae TaxID=347 RepID=UPI001034A200|nr:hypothetical protein [Xanthomonas oryzae]QBH05532.1 hypothetical protein EYC57_22330 [Xanthomonas oryzae]